MAGVSGQENVLAQRLNRLFATVHPAGRGPYTLREVADAINPEAGETIISASYLSQLRAGQRREPSHSRLVAIARFFGVDIDYFSAQVSAEDARPADRGPDRHAGRRSPRHRAARVRPVGAPALQPCSP